MMLALGQAGALQNSQSPADAIKDGMGEPWTSETEDDKPAQGHNEQPPDDNTGYEQYISHRTTPLDE